MTTEEPTPFTFHVRVNDGPERTLTVLTGLYDSAVAAVPAVFGIDGAAFPVAIEIWVPSLLPEYGLYLYMINEPGGAALTAIRTP